MKKTQFVEILRMIRSTKAFCLTMVVVTALGIIAYTGISFATDSLRNSCETYYDEYNFYDLQLGSVYGFSDDTLEKLKENEHVNDAEAVYYTQELVTIGQDDYVAEIYTASGELNKSRLVSGRLPQKDGECAAEQALLDRFGLNVGDTIRLSGSSDQLNSTEYTIVGAVDLVTVFATNDFYNRGTSNLGDGQVTTKIMVTDSAFSEDAVRQLCYVTVNNRGQRGSDEYFTYIHSVRDELMPIVEDAGQQEYDSRHSDYQQKIDDAQSEYDEGQQKIADADDAISDAKQKLADAKEKLKDKKKELEDGKTSLEEAEATLDSYQQQLTDSRATLDENAGELSSAKAQLDAAAAQLDNAKSQLDASRSQLDTLKAGLDTAAEQLSQQRTQLDAYAPQLDAAKQSLDELQEQLSQQQAVLAGLQQTLAETDPESEEYAQIVALCDAQQSVCDNLQLAFDSANTQYQEQLDNYNSAENAYNSAEAEYQTQYVSWQSGEETYASYLQEYQSNQSIYDSQLAKYNDSYVSYQSGEAAYASGKQQLEEYQQEYDDNVKLLDEGQEAVASAEKEISEKNSELESKENELEEKKNELTDAGESLETAKQNLQDMPLSQTFSSDINANPSYYYYTQSTNGTETIVATLCTLLLGIAILVCFTTISRMVTEQHRIIGTQKAMGFLPHEIYGKYIIYVAICTICGIILGLAASYFMMEKLVYRLVYGSAFILQDFTPIINWKDTALIAALELAAMCLSAFLACRSMLKKNAISLLNSNIRDDKGLGKTENSRLPLRVSMVLRNLRSNPQILATTLVSVMGCTILMISVFTVHHGMSGISPRQFSELQHYQGTLTLNKDADESDLAEIQDFLSNTDTVQLLPVMEKFVSYKTEDSTQYATLIGIDPSEDASPFLEILDADTLKQMKIPDQGVLICKKMAENYGYSVGDTFTLVDSMGGEHETFIAGVFDRNIGMAIIVSPSYYAEVMDTDTDICQYYVMGSPDAISQFCDEARTYKAYCNYSDSGYYKAEMEFKVSCVNKVILVVVIITGLLSLFVLFNLAQMNIRKKEKEIVVMKVLGFPPDRIRGYVFWEAMIMCTIGLIFGVIIGGPLGSYLTRAVEMSNLQDIRGISLSSCILGGAINLTFYTLTNLFSLTGIRKIKMTGSAREA